MKSDWARQGKRKIKAEKDQVQESNEKTCYCTTAWERWDGKNAKQAVECFETVFFENFGFWEDNTE